MKRLHRELGIIYAFIERQARLYWRYWPWEVVWFVYTLANAFAIGFLGKGIEKVTGSQINREHLITYLLVGSLLWGYLSHIFWEIGSVVQIERWEGTLEYTFMAPISRPSHLMGMCSFALIYGVVRTTLLLVIIALFFHLDLTKANLAAAAGIMAVASFSFVGLGVAIAVVPMIAPERGEQTVQIMEAALLMVSGVYYPVSILPGWMQLLSRFSPATYALSGMRKALGVAPIAGLAGDVTALALLGAILAPLGALVFRRAELWAKKRGTLARSG